MKLLFDENLSPKLPQLIATTFPESQHVRELGLKGHTDEEIWRHAGEQGFTLISKDKDFYQRALLFGSPPKIIWLCIGNCTRADLLSLIHRHEQGILAFDASPESVLILT